MIAGEKMDDILWLDEQESAEFEKILANLQPNRSTREEFMRIIAERYGEIISSEDSGFMFRYHEERIKVSFSSDGEMTVMASGSDIAFERLAPVLEAVAGKVYRIGAEPGLGSTVKIIHQLLAGVHIAAGAEAMALAARAGIPLDVMYDVVTNAAGNSWMFENRMRHVVDGDYTPHSAVDIFVKDLGLVADTAKALHFPLPLASTALNMFTSASNAGYGKEDDSAVIKIFSGITLPGAKS